jgi:hypothetical protein
MSGRRKREKIRQKRRNPYMSVARVVEGYTQRGRSHWFVYVTSHMVRDGEGYVVPVCNSQTLQRGFASENSARHWITKYLYKRPSHLHGERLMIAPVQSVPLSTMCTKRL